LIMSAIRSLKLVAMLRLGMQMLAITRKAFGVVRQHLAFEGLDAGIRANLETFDDIALDALAMAATAGVAVARAAAMVGPVPAFCSGLALSLLRGLDQRVRVRDRDLVVVGMDFAEGKEAMAVAAIFDESGLEGRFDPCDLGEVDIAAQLLA